MRAGSNSNKWKMFLLFGEFFMLFNDKKLTMYTSSKKRLDFKFISCISQYRLSTENSRYIYWKYHFTGKKKLTGSVAIMLMLYLSMDQIVTCPNIAAWEEVLFLLCLKNLVWSFIYLFSCCGSNVPLVWSFSKKPDFYCPLLRMVLSIEHKIQTSLKIKRIEPQHRIHLLMNTYSATCTGTSIWSRCTYSARSSSRVT